MGTVVYIANQFPAPVEPYVWQEAEELRKRGLEILFCSMRRPRQPLPADLQRFAGQTLYLQPLHWRPVLSALWLGVRNLPSLRALLQRVILGGRESPSRRIRALMHTWIGAYCAVTLAHRNVRHIHVHHGYFGAWVGMVAARLLGATYSLTLHGSDLLLHQAYLDVKLKQCAFCVTVSEFNRRHILERWPIEPQKVLVQRLGIDVNPSRAPRPEPHPGPVLLLSVGRLHPVKNHALLIKACAELKRRGLQFECLIAGEGPERSRLQRGIAKADLGQRVRLLGHVHHHQLSAFYAMADLVVLTSRSEGIPLALMEAMSHGTLVLAPAITGIPELVIDGQTGFLYRAASLSDLVSKVETIARSVGVLPHVRAAAREHVSHHFDRRKNLPDFAESFINRLQKCHEADAA